MKPDGFARSGRLVACGLVLVAMSIAIVRVFELIESAQATAKSAPPAPVIETIPIPAAEPSPLEIWLNDPQGDPAPFWSDLVTLAENPATPVATRERVRLILARYSMPHIHELIRRAKVEVDECEAEFRVERQRRDQKAREIERDIEELKLRYPLAASDKDPNLYGPEEMKELVSYAHSYKRDRMVLDGALARLGEVLDADYRRIRLEQSVFKSQICQLERILDKPGYLPVASPENWDPKLLPPEQRVHAHVSFESMDVRLEELTKHLTQICGVPIAFDPDVNDLKNTHINLRVEDMDVTNAAAWVARLADLDVVKEGDGFVLYQHGRKKKIAPERVDRPAIPNVPNDTPQDF